MQKIVFSLLLVLIANTLHAQKEDYIWYFGPTGAGIDFNTCQPVLLTNGVNDGYAWEGSVTICNKQTGKLLFYTNGYNVYNAKHDTMLNGKQAGIGNTQTQNLIIPFPGSDSLYYMFTPDVQTGILSNSNYPNARGINYAVIDMSKDNGNGAVLSKFNILKDTPNCEKLTAIRHQNGGDIWLLGHEYRNNNFFVFKISSSGINTTPIKYSIGPSIGVLKDPNFFDAIGELKASPDGTKIAFTTFYNGTTTLCDFDNATGTISNPVILNIGKGGGYGISFSPDNKKLYISRNDTAHNVTPVPDSAELLQFDISSGNQTTIQNTKASLFKCSKCGFGSIKLAPNKKIYVARFGQKNNWQGDSSLGVINYPDSAGMACDYVHDGFSLHGIRGSWGLNNEMEYGHQCIDGSDTTTRTLELNSNNADMKLYPNPFNDLLKISINKLNINSIRLKIVNSMGTTIFYSHEDITGNKFVKSIDLSNIPQGIYYLVVSINNDELSRIIEKK